MRQSTAILALAALSVGLMGTSLVLAHGGATGIVKERMDTMEVISKANKTLGAMFKGDVDFDPESVRDAALQIKSHSGETMTKLFPEGSDGKPSEALPAIWEDWATFEALADDLATFSQTLADTAANPRGGPHGGKGMMGGSEHMMQSGQGMMGQGMMGQGMMANGGPDAAMLASMPPDAAYRHLTQTCSSCHTKFRLEKK